MVHNMRLRCINTQLMWGGGGGQRGTNQGGNPQVQLIKYVSRLGYMMSLIICMIVVRKCNKKFVHSQQTSVKNEPSYAMRLSEYTVQ